MDNKVELIFNNYKKRLEQKYDIEHVKTNLMISEEKFISSLNEKQKNNFSNIKLIACVLIDEIIKDVIDYTIKNNMD